MEGALMPIRPENKSLYPADWPAIRASIRERARDRCEWCGVRNYAVGHRDEDGRFAPEGGTLLADEAGAGLLGYTGAVEYAAAMNAEREWNPEQPRLVVVVCTTAHLDHTPENNDPANLAFLCQKCHNGHDAKTRAAGIKDRRVAASGQLTMEAAR